MFASGVQNFDYSCGDGINGLLELGQTDHVMVDVPYKGSVDEANQEDRVRKPKAFGFKPFDAEDRHRMSRAIGSVCRRWCLLFCAYEETHLWRAELEAAGMRYWQQGHWHRLNPKPQMGGRGPAQACEALLIMHSAIIEQRWNGGGKSAIWSTPIVKTEDRYHPTQKPTLLMKMLIEDFTDPGELIADPCAGVATTGVAALALERRFWGRDLDPEHVKNGLARLSMPLFDRVEQLSIAGVEPKGIAAKARTEIDRKILTLITNANSHGLGAQEISQIMMSDGIEGKDLQRALARLTNAGAIRKEGRTANTRYFHKHKEQS